MGVGAALRGGNWVELVGVIQHDAAPIPELRFRRRELQRRRAHHPRGWGAGLAGGVGLGVAGLAGAPPAPDTAGEGDFNEL